MLILISPAKRLKEDLEIKQKLSSPVFLRNSKELLSIMKKKSKNDLMKLMSISDKLAQLNKQRYSQMEIPQPKDQTLPAALTFSGDTYIGLKFSEFSSKDQEYAQKKLRILSGLYGVLRPMDAIQPYRLEMGTQLKTKDFNNLYEHWSEVLTKQINKELKENTALVNLASNEYFNAINKKDISKPIITPTFKEEKNGKLKIISFNAKRARGMMSRFIIKNKLTCPQELLDFNEDNYQYSSEHSDELTPTFIR